MDVGTHLQEKRTEGGQSLLVRPEAETALREQTWCRGPPGGPSPGGWSPVLCRGSQCAALSVLRLFPAAHPVLHHPGGRAEGLCRLPHPEVLCGARGEEPWTQLTWGSFRC